MSSAGEITVTMGWAQDRARLWRAGWIAGCAVILILDAAIAQAPWPQLALAMIAAALPAMAGLALGDDRPRLQLAQWAVCAAVAAALGGGLEGPLAAFCLSPLAASAAFGGRRRLAEGGALSLATVMALALMEAGGADLPSLQPEGFSGVLCIGLTTLGLCAAVALDHARLAGVFFAREGRLAALGRDSERRLGVLATVVGGQAGHLLLVERGRGVRAVFGGGLAGVAPAAVEGFGLVGLAEPWEGEGVRGVLDACAGEAQFALASDRERVLSLELTPYNGGATGILRDASLQRARETATDEARRRAESESAGRARFVAAMSHELRTPLNAIIGFSDVMRQRLFGPLSDRYGEYAQLIHESGQHLLDLIGDVLDISKIEADRYELHREIFDAREAVQAALRLQRPQADSSGVALRADLGSAPLEIDADRRALKQIVLNLVSNALKFTPKGGSVAVTLSRQGEMLELGVSDTGVGIAPEDIERLGRPYEQAGDAASRRKGTGLGLSLVRALAGLHGGEMSVESVLGEGTSFTVRLPLTPPPAVEPGGNVVAFAPR